MPTAPPPPAPDAAWVAHGAPADADDSAAFVSSALATTPESADTAAVLEAMSGAQRAAVLLVALGVEAASPILSRLSDEDVEAVSVEIARLQNVSGDQVEAVLGEYHDVALAQSYVSQGGAAFARQMLEAALGGERAEDVMMKVEAAMEVSAFHMLQTVDLVPLLDFLENEHPQTVALILTQLNTRKASDLINHLDAEVQREVVVRIANMAAPLPNVLREVEDVIRQYIGAGLGADTGSRGGAERVADILSASSRTTEQSIMEGLRERDPELAATIKGLMFVFDDLVHLDGRALQKVLMEVEQQDLALALKAAPDVLQRKVFENVSERVAQTVREEIELLGPVAVSQVDDAQARVLQAATELEARGEVTLTRNPVETI
ncbi:flagellar motor switch protein FliG [Rubrivirga sp. S365]|uniref:Flagellar motor switch protein FliG n=1 Tax=Rubrivirga litoralis TaxID=3075598 RepID=A0ABU3BT67_9BACT|nr:MULTISPECIES: flagellar motor switch protein FliG [unclassified Rubrivirga]MDT0632361.1 flagellar motor switch protein FliG [Rubrivirga sp. F394]MDT7857327.1 flagellar motor switch protein FliG [Rubrivirga sp. S365]